MSVAELIEILQQIEDKDMTVVLGVDESLEDICYVDSKQIKIKFNDTGEDEILFVLAPCFCDLEFSEEDIEEEDDSIENINSLPRLN